jgi:hypothetical protein
MRYSANTDPDLHDWLRWASEGGEVPNFIRAIAEAAFLADVANYALLRPVLFELKRQRPRECQTSLDAENVMDSDADFLDEMEKRQQGQLEAPRLRTLYENAAERYSDRAKRFNEMQTDAATGRISFFQKITIGTGASIAAIVSFLGTKSHTLQPRWVLRASLVTLAFVLFTALLRNFLPPQQKLWADSGSGSLPSV